MIVVDASLVFEYLSQGAGAASIERRFIAEGLLLQAPELLSVELLSVLRGRESLIDSPGRTIAILEAIQFLPVRLYPHAPLLPRIWQLRHNITPYDAAYVALSEALDAPLLTRDRKLAKSKGHRARIEVI